MSDTPVPLHRPVGEWPFLLAGPMLRRVTSQSVAVFVAMRDRCTVSLQVFDSASSTTPLATRPLYNRVVSLGQKLHVCVAEVAPATGAFDLGRPYFYDVRFANGGITWGLSDPRVNDDVTGLLTGPFALGYSEGARPSFMVPLDRDHLRIVHASCRKPHGCNLHIGTDADALPLLDRVFSEHLTITDPDEKLRQRPDQLIMTGDQIYADDVAASLLAAVTSIGRSLLAWETPERFPDRRNIEAFVDTHEDLKPGKRSIFLDDQKVKVRPPDADDENRTDEDVDALEDMEDDDVLDGGNDGDYAANHLLFFSEFCAMYVLNWSPALWALRDPVQRNLYPNSSTYVLPRPTDFWEHSPDTTTPALIFAEGLPYVRRVLANVATYMIFDDHDVTDDWFLNKAVHDRMRRGETSSLSGGGRRLMRNGLAAYAIFQHWGNAPEQFDSGTPGGRLLDLFDLFNPEVAVFGDTPPIGQEGRETDADVLLDVGPEPLPVTRRTERLQWHYVLNFPSHRLLVLDTRTWREFPGSLEETGATEVLDAMADRLEDLGEWGLVQLRDFQELWTDAAQELVEMGANTLGQLIGAGANLMEKAAAVAEAIHTATGPNEDLLIETVAAVDDSLSALGACADVRDTSFGSGAIDKARSALGRWHIDPEAEAVDDAVFLALTVDVAVTAIRAQIKRTAATFAIDAAVTAAERASAGCYAVSNWLHGVSGYIKAAAASQAEAARKAALLHPLWLKVAGDVAIRLTNATPAAAARVAEAVTASGPVQAALETAVRLRTTYLDPVWTMLLGKGADEFNAGLIGEEAVQFQVRDALAGDGSAPPFTIVVSPAPLFGHWLVEMYQTYTMTVGVTAKQMKRRLAEPRAESNENEPWAGNLRAYHRALAALASLGSVVVLSGDVHYAFSSVNDYVGRDGRRARFIQLVSSAAKNSWLPTRLLAAFDADQSEFLNPVRIGTEAWNALPTAESVAGLVTYENLYWTRDRLLQGANQEWAEFQESLPSLPWPLDIESPDLGAARDAAKQAVLEAPEKAKLRAAEFGRSLEQSVQRLEYDFRESLQTPWRFDFLYNLPLMTQQTLVLFRQLGLDSAQFDQVETTVLHDRRLASRALDSPELEARLRDREVERPYILQSERRSVGRANIGIVSFVQAAGGTAVVHELHSYPFDERPWVLGNQAPPPSPVFRGDWIVTRHKAGLTWDLPADMGVDE